MIFLVEPDLEIALLGDSSVFFTASGTSLKRACHLFSRTQKELLRLIGHALGVGELRLRADTDQTIMRVRIRFVHVVNIIGRNKFKPEFFVPSNQLLCDLGLFGNAVILDFEIKIFGPKNLLIPIDRFARFRQLILPNQAAKFRCSCSRIGRSGHLYTERAVLYRCAAYNKSHRDARS